MFSPFVSLVQKKKRRRSRWSAGFYSKKKSSCSPHTSRDDAHLGSDEEEEDGDDEEDLEKGGGTEGDEGIEGKEEQMVVDAPAQDGSDQKEGDVISQAAENEVNLRDTGKTENDHQSQNDKRKVDKSTQQHGQSEENNKVLEKAGNEKSEAQLNTNQDRHTETETGTRDTASMGDCGTANIQQVSKPENNVKIVTVTEAEQNSLNELMEVEADETASKDTSEAVKGEDTCTGWIYSVSLFRLGSLCYNVDMCSISCLNNVFVSCLRADCKVHDSVSKECCNAAADDQCGQGSADLGPGNSSGG